MKRLYMVLLLLLPLAGGAEIYRWTDDQGNVHFSDTAREPDAERVEVKVQTVKMVRVESLSKERRTLAPSSSGVVMYSTTWCGVCKRAKRYFAERGVPFQEKDIEANRRWREEFDALGGKGVPLILVGKQAMSGFSSNRFEQLYQSAQR